MWEARHESFSSVEVCCAGTVGGHDFHLRGPGALELADAWPFRLAHDHVLAGPGHSGVEQDSLRRIPRPARLGWTLARPHDGALGEYDAGGAREVPLRPASRLRQPHGNSAAGS